MKKRIALLGATGSIGDSALSVVAHFPDRFEIVSMSAGSNLDKLLPAIAAHRPKVVSVKTREDAARLRQEFPGLSVGFGPQGLVDVATIPEADVVLGGIVGSIGLAPAYEAVKLGKTLALANKETLVVAGEPLMAAARASGAMVLPVDSEHCALHQALRAGDPGEVKRLVLTASGGPFRARDLVTFGGITVPDALSGRGAGVRRARDWRLGSGGAERRERGRGPGVPRPAHSVSRDRRDGRSHPRQTSRRARDDRRGRSRRRRVGAVRGRRTPSPARN